MGESRRCASVGRRRGQGRPPDHSEVDDHGLERPVSRSRSRWRRRALFSDGTGPRAAGRERRQRRCRGGFARAWAYCSGRGGHIARKRRGRWALQWCECNNHVAAAAPLAATLFCPLCPSVRRVSVANMLCGQRRPQCAQQKREKRRRGRERERGRGRDHASPV